MVCSFSTPFSPNNPVHGKVLLMLINHNNIRISQVMLTAEVLFLLQQLAASNNPFLHHAAHYHSHSQIHV